MIFTKRLFLTSLMIYVVFITIIVAHPSIGTCFRNCSQCKKFLGIYFDVQLCDEYCVKFKGKMTPDVEDPDSLAPFITNLNEVQ
ncbi:PREDICTED: eclosion hormone [Ceratosolen solmsi marchali]|uniref:Eclosion hormone n=1 Tax=Ceratosolen solmsi marchali TaxID=326594 RepID=A0AAJ7E1I1_9HYME|nr:PREDICTED: eclosion hormone [Ceratosolen solmsi marchali]